MTGSGTSQGYYELPVRVDLNGSVMAPRTAGIGAELPMSRV